MKALQYGRQASDFTESPKAEYFSVYIENSFITLQNLDIQEFLYTEKRTNEKLKQLMKFEV